LRRLVQDSGIVRRSVDVVEPQRHRLLLLLGLRRVKTLTEWAPGKTGTGRRRDHPQGVLGLAGGVLGASASGVEPEQPGAGLAVIRVATDPGLERSRVQRCLAVHPLPGDPGAG